MFAELFNGDNRAFTLWRVKRLVFVISLFTFLVRNRGNNLAVAEFLWMSFIARAGDAPINAFYMHVNEAMTQLAASIGLLTGCVVSAWMICFTLNAFVPSYMTEADLNAEREKASKYYLQIVRETQGLERAQRNVAELVQLRSELSKLLDALKEIRVEAGAISAKRSKRGASSPAQNSPDLFAADSTASLSAKTVRKTPLQRQRRKSSAPDF